MRGLARSLCFDPGIADDVAQSSLLSAMERPPRDATNLRGWLRQLVLNTARQFGRSEARRKRRDATAAPPGSLPLPETLVLAAETQGRLVAAVLRLEEPYRQTILLRYFEGHEPDEIAKRLQVPSSTIRSRHKRALDRLRELLDGEYGNGRDEWKKALLPLATPPALSSSLVGGGVLSMSLKWKITIAAGIAFLALGSKSVLERASLTTTVGPERTLAASSKILDSKVLDRPIGSGDESNPNDDSELPTRESTSSERDAMTFRGTVVRPDETPVANARVHAFATIAETDDEARAIGTVTTGEDGEFAITIESTRLPSDECSIVATAERMTHSRIATLTAGSHCRLELRDTARLCGRVLDAATREPIEEAKVFRGDSGAVTTDRAGAYAFDDVPIDTGIGLDVVHPDYPTQHESILLRGKEGGSRDILLDRGFVVRLCIVDRVSMTPIEGARIEGLGLGREDERTLSDSAGGFAFRATHRQQITMEVSKPDYFATAWRWEAWEPKADETIVIPLYRGARVRGTVVDADHHPIPDVAVHAVVDDVRANPVDGVAEAARLGTPGVLVINTERQGTTHGVSDALGRFVLFVVPSEKAYEIEARHDEYAVERTRPFHVDSPESHPSFDIELERGGTLEGRVTRNSRPWIDDEVVLKDASGHTVNAHPGALGQYRFERVHSGDSHILLRSLEGRESDESVVHVEVGRVTVHDFARNAEITTLRGSVVDESGRRLTGIRVIATAELDDGRDPRYGITDSSGAFEFELEGSGPFRFVAERGAARVEERRVDPSRGDVRLVLPTAAILRLRLVDETTKEPIRSSGDSLWSFGWRRLGGVRFERASGAGVELDIMGNVEFETLTGSIDVSIHLNNDGYQPTVVSAIQVPPEGTPVARVVELKRGASLSLRAHVVTPLGRRLVESHNFFLLDEAQSDSISTPNPAAGREANMHVSGGLALFLGDIGLMNQQLMFGNDGVATLHGLAAGDYVLRGFPEDVVVEPATIRIGGADGPRGEVEFSVRPK